MRGLRGIMMCYVPEAYEYANGCRRSQFLCLARPALAPLSKMALPGDLVTRVYVLLRPQVTTCSRGSRSAAAARHGAPLHVGGQSQVT